MANAPEPMPEKAVRPAYFDVAVQVEVTRTVTVRLRSLDKNVTTVSDIEKQAFDTLKASRKLEASGDAMPDISLGWPTLKAAGIKFVDKDD